MSIITVVRNSEKKLEQTIQSVLNQTYENIEYIIVDGASTDGTLNIIQKYENEIVYWVSEPDKGIYDAMNKGIAKAKGDYLLFLNAGDEIAQTDGLEKICLSIQKDNQPDILYGDAFERTSSGERLYKRSRSHKLIWYGMFIHHQAIIYKRESIGSTRYRLEYPIGADYAFTAELLNRSHNVVYLPFPICIFEQGGLSSNSTLQGLKDYWYIGKNILKLSLLTRITINTLHVLIHSVKIVLPWAYKKIVFSQD